MCVWGGGGGGGGGGSNGSTSALMVNMEKTFEKDVLSAYRQIRLGRCSRKCVKVCQKCNKIC